MNYKKMKEVLAEKEEAVNQVMTFLANETTYDDFMEQLAMTQTHAMKIAGLLGVYKKESVNVDPFTSFFDDVQCLLIALKPLARIAEKEAASDGE